MRNSLCLLLALTLSLALYACNESGADKRATALNVDRSKLTAFILQAPPATIAMPIHAVLDGKIELLGFDYQPKPLRPGRTFAFTFYYRALAEIPEDYTFFGHLEAENGRSYRMLLDHTPVAGRYPTPAWHKGDIIKDVHRGRLEGGFSGNKAVLYAGFFKGDERMKVAPESEALADKENRIRLGMVDVEEVPDVKMTLNAYRIKDSSLTLDGLLNKPAWAAADTTPLFVNTNGQTVNNPTTLAKVLWDSNYLYVAFDCQDPDIWATYTQHDDPLYKEEAVEIMIDADGSQSTYTELQVNAAGTIFDAYWPERRKDVDMAFDAHLKVGVHVDGTINKHDDVDKGWTTEIAIPFSSIRDAPHRPPLDGETWRVNFYRMDKPNAKSQIGMMWSPTYVGDYHALDRFGYITFRDLPPDKKPAPASAPAPAPAPLKPAQLPVPAPAAGPKHP